MALSVETADRVLDYERSRNDLHAHFFCKVLATSGRWAGMGCLGSIHVSGYADAYFFDEVNRDDRSPVECPECGARFAYRWTRAGVLVSGALGAEVAP